MGLYAVPLHGGLAASVREALLAVVDADCRERAARFRHQEDRDRLLAAHGLLRLLLRREWGLPLEKLRLARNPWGKPVLADPGDVHFNLSHSGDWAVCALDGAPVGVDVEAVRPVDELALARFFSAEEHRELGELAGGERRARFYDIWTLKESYVKMLGCGLSLPLDAFSVAREEGRGYLLASSSEGESGYFRQYRLEAGYACSVCARHDSFPQEVTVLAPERLREWCLNTSSCPS